jgi:ADP-heptose:LPS heptosyltransferase
MHLAVALERPLVCIVGPTHPDRTGPYRRREDVVRLDLDCAPCYLRKRSQCRFDHRCMEELPVPTVLEAVRVARSGRRATGTRAPGARSTRVGPTFESVTAVDGS